LGKDYQCTILCWLWCNGIIDWSKSLKKKLLMQIFLLNLMQWNFLFSKEPKKWLLM
jgi:hypothetical protein